MLEIVCPPVRTVAAVNTSETAIVVPSYCVCVITKSFLLVDNAVLNLAAWLLVTVTVTVLEPLLVGSTLLLLPFTDMTILA